MTMDSMEDRRDPATHTAYDRRKAETYDQQRFNTPAGKAIHDAEFRYLHRPLSQLPLGGRVLEVGCGTGRLLLQVAAAGFRVDGIDASPDMIRLLEAKALDVGPEVDLRVAEAAHLPFDAEIYDLVYAVRVLNQTASKEYALAVVTEMLRVVKPGGYVLVEFVNHYRPRWGAARGGTVRLRPSEVASHGRSLGAEVDGHFGAFLLSMQAFHVAPVPLVGMVAKIDRVLSGMLPRLCARSVILFRKAAHG